MEAIIKKNQTDFRVSDQQIVDNYFVGFGAKSAIYSGPERYPGHAFVAFGNGDPLTCSENGEYETWGFYGVANPDYLYFLKNVQGIFVRDDISDPDLFFFVNVDFNDHIKALMVKDSFFQTPGGIRDYDLYKRNCVAYIDKVATVLSHKVRVPKKDNFIDIPVDYVQELIKLNRQ